MRTQSMTTWTAIALAVLASRSAAAVPVQAPAATPCTPLYAEDWTGLVGGIGGRGVGIDSAGNVYSTGASLNLPSNGYRHDILTMKYAPDGTLLWQATYNNGDDLSTQDDDPSWLTLDGQDNVIVVGTTKTNATGKVGVTLKYDPDGNLLWESLHGDYGFFVETDAQNNIYVLGRTFGDNWDYDTAKYDPDGNLLWSRQRNFGGLDEPKSLAVSASGRIVVVGQNWNQRVETVVYDADGNELWTAELEDLPNAYVPTHVTFDPAGDLWITGLVGTAGNAPVFLAKYAPDGQLRFETRYALGTANRVRIDSQGNALVSGQTSLGGLVLTIKVDPDGNELWTATHPWGNAYDLAVLSDDTVVVASGKPGGSLPWSLLGYSPAGQLQWIVQSQLGGLFDYPRRMAVNANDVIAVNGNGGIATARYSLEPPAATAYCTAGTSASGCQAVLGACGQPSATLASGFAVSASGVEGAKDGLFFYGVSGQQANSWGNGTSYQCVMFPVSRGGLLIGTGTAGACDGSFSQDLNARWTAKPSQNPGAGAVVQAQLWYRDPFNTSNQTTSLSDAIEFTVAP